MILGGREKQSGPEPPRFFHQGVKVDFVDYTDLFKHWIASEATEGGGYFFNKTLLHLIVSTDLKNGEPKSFMIMISRAGCPLAPRVLNGRAIAQVVWLRGVAADIHLALLLLSEEPFAFNGELSQYNLIID